MEIHQRVPKILIKDPLNLKAVITNEDLENIRKKEHPFVVSQIQIIDENSCIFRTILTGAFYLEFEKQKKTKLYDVQLANPGEKDWALDQSRKKIFFQTKGSLVYYCELKTLINHEDFGEEIILPTNMVPGVSKVKNIKDETFLVKSYLDIFLMEGRNIIKIIECDAVIY